MASILSAGTTSATALNMSADTSGVLQLASNNGTVGLTLDTSQNVGIGTSSPTAVLHTIGPNGSYATTLAETVTYTKLRFQNSSASSLSLFQGVTNSSSAAWYFQIANGPGTGAYDIALNPFGGNVGIGTSSPVAALSVSKQTTTLSGTSQPYGVHIYPTGSGLCYIDALTSSTSNTSLGLRTYNNGTYNEMRIDSSGSVGIGTSAPFTKLTVNGGISPSAAPSSNWGLDFAPSTSSGTFVTIANNGTYDLATGSGFVYIYDDGASGVAQIAFYYGITTIVWQSASLYSITSGTASKINVYYNGGTNAYRIQNLTGGSKNLWISTMRMRAST